VGGEGKGGKDTTAKIGGNTCVVALEDATIILGEIINRPQGRNNTYKYLLLQIYGQALPVLLVYSLVIKINTIV
jgi:hypothetical protein